MCGCSLFSIQQKSEATIRRQTIQCSTKVWRVPENAGHCSLNQSCTGVQNRGRPIAKRVKSV